MMTVYAYIKWIIVLSKSSRYSYAISDGPYNSQSAACIQFVYLLIRNSFLTTLWYKMSSKWTIVCKWFDCERRQLVVTAKFDYLALGSLESEPFSHDDNSSIKWKLVYERPALYLEAVTEENSKFQFGITVPASSGLSPNVQNWIGKKIKYGYLKEYTTNFGIIIKYSNHSFLPMTV